MELSKTTLLVGFLVFSILSAGAELQNLDGSTWVNDEYNWTLTFQTNNLSNSNITVVNETLQLEDDNISFGSTSSQQINSTFYKYNLSTQPSIGDEVFRLETEGKGTINYEITGIPSVASEQYLLEVDGEKIKTQSSGGKVSWSYDNWNSKHNFTLTYREKPEENVEQDDGGGGSIDIDPNDDYNPSSNTQSWKLANKDRFNFDSIEEDTQLRNISVQTVSNRDSFEISAEKVEQSEAPQIEDAYQLYEINTSADDTEIEQTSIEFEVNRSFAENYDNITLARHNDGWEQLPTKPVETTGEKWLYQASSTGFSYYAVQGINNQETGDTENNSDTNQTREGGEDNQTEQPENQTPQQNTDQTKDSVNEGYGQSDITLWFILPAVAVILLITYFGYSVRKKS